MNDAQQTGAPLIVIVGPTASGKTALAIEVAKMCQGEIICADSRTVYKGMDLGTAKPSIEERQGIPHWGLDIVAPDAQFTAADFQRYAEQKIQEIRSRGGVPIIAGGTGLYVDAVIFSYEFGDRADESHRQNLEAMSLGELHIYCNKNNITLPENYRNKRYVIRAIEQKGVNEKRSRHIINNTIVVGISTNRDELRTRIECRVEQMLQHGVVEEAKMLGKKYGWGSQGMTGNIYALVHEYQNNNMTLHELQQKALVQDWRLAKRQRTWFRRNSGIQWYSPDEAYDYLRQALAPWVSS